MQSAVSRRPNVPEDCRKPAAVSRARCESVARANQGDSNEVIDYESNLMTPTLRSYESYVRNLKLPPLELWNHGKTLREIYVFLENPRIYCDNLSNRIKATYNTTYDPNSNIVREAITDAVVYAYQYMQHAKSLAEKEYEESSDKDDSSDESSVVLSDEEDSVFSSKKGPDYPEFIQEIKCNFRTMAEFLVFTQSIPPIDMSFRNNKLFESVCGYCFCPFSKGIGKILEWFPENEEPTFKFLLEKQCKKNLV